MQDLLQSNQHFRLDIIQSKPLSQNNLDHGSQTSTPCLFKKIPSLETFFNLVIIIEIAIKKIISKIDGIINFQKTIKIILNDTYRLVTK